MNADKESALMDEDLWLPSRGHLQETEGILGCKKRKKSLMISVVKDRGGMVYEGEISSRSCISGNRRWLLWVVGVVGHTAMQLTAFASVGCRTSVIPGCCWVSCQDLRNSKNIMRETKPSFGSVGKQTQKVLWKEMQIVWEKQRLSFRTVFPSEFPKVCNNAQLMH